MQRTLAGMIDQKLLYGEFRHNIPAENMPRIEQNLLGPFEEREMPRLMKQLDVNSQREAGAEAVAAGLVDGRCQAHVQRTRDRLGVDSHEDRRNVERRRRARRKWSSTIENNQPNSNSRRKRAGKN